MHHTIAAVFDRQNQAEQAIDDLVASGYSRDDLHLSQSVAGEPAGQVQEDQSFGSGIKSFFSDLFGTSSHPDAQLYSAAVAHGNYVLTVDVNDDDQVDRVTEVLDRHHPIDIDEEAKKWKSGGWSASEPMMQSAASGQQSPASQQSSVSQQSPASQQSSASQQFDTGQQSQSGSTAIPVIQEALKVGKRMIQRGGVRIFRRVVETPVQESVNLNEEHVVVERHAVDQPASAADLAAFEEGSFEVRETAEEPVIEKVARVVEEVVIGKHVTQHQEQISDTLRRTEVEVEQLAGQAGQSAMNEDESYYRTHWNSNYASLGGSYDDYAPAYRYGSALASSERYKGRRWDDIESDIRSGWESQNTASAWEKIKNAVRHGWERITS